MSDDLIRFLRARLDEDEAWALAASQGRDGSTLTGERWHWACESTGQPVDLDPALSEYVEGRNDSSVGLRSVEEYSIPGFSRGLPHFVVSSQDEMRVVDAAHIARHDPARVLREVEAKRRLIDACVETLADEDKWDVQLDGGSGEEFALARWALRLLAIPYDQHPDYREEWRP